MTEGQLVEYEQEYVGVLSGLAYKNFSFLSPTALFLFQVTKVAAPGDLGSHMLKDGRAMLSLDSCMSP